MIIQALQVMLFGMLGIFIVMGLIALSIRWLGGMQGNDEGQSE